MTDYNKATGTAGTLTIRDTGTTVEFWISCSDGATNVGSLSWSGTVNGSSVGGSVGLPGGFGSKRVASYTVTSSQTVAFNIGASGTQGIGGPTNQSAAINRAPVATVPGAPGVPVASAIAPTSARLTWTAASSGGPPITQYGLYVSEKSDFSSYVLQKWVGTVLTYPVTGLKPGTTYYTRTRAQNSVGVGPYSATSSFKTPAGVYVSDGTNWNPCQLFVSDGTTWNEASVSVSDGTTWKPAG